MINSWLTIGVIAGALAAIGNAFDRLLARRQKRVLFENMVAWWLKLSETEFPVLHIKMASDALSYFRHFSSGKLRVWKVLCGMIVGSFLLTSISCFIGFAIDLGIADQFQGPGVPLPIFTVYLANFPFDIATMIVTYFALGVVARSKPLKGILIISLDVAAASILAMLSLTFISWGGDMAISHELLGSELTVKRWEKIYKEEYGDLFSERGFSNNAKIRLHTGLPYYIRITPEAFRSAWFDEPVSQDIILKFVVVEGGRTETIWASGRHITARSDAAMALTTLIPTAAYMFYLLFLMIARTILEALRLGSMQYLEVATEVDPTENPKDFIPGTLFGAVIGILAAIANAVLKLVSK